MNKLLELVKREHQERLMEIACYKDLLYFICSNGDAYGLVYGGFNNHFIDVRNQNRDIKVSTDIETFLRNLMKDTKPHDHDE